MEKVFHFSDKIIKIKRSSHSGLVETASGFKATLSQLRALHTYKTGEDISEHIGWPTCSSETQKNHLMQLRRTNGHSKIEDLIEEADQHELLYPVTIIGIVAVLEEDLGSDRLHVRRKFRRSQTLLYPEE